MDLFVRKSIDQLRRDAFAGGEHALKRALGSVNLVALGIGAIIGAGIFTLTGNAAAQYAGPAVVLSFVLAGIGCAFAGLCYSEFASMIPIAGSAYTYGYATLGEFIAWIIGWDLILEYLFSASTVAVGWSGFVASFLRDLGIHISPQWYNAPSWHIWPPAVHPSDLVLLPGSPSWIRVTSQLESQLAGQGIDVTSLPHATGVFNLVAMVAVAALTVILVIGIRESAAFNNAIVVVKLAVLTMFIVAGAYFVFRNPGVAADNWTPFVPPNAGRFGEFGWSGVLRAAGVIFFAYIGFDAVSTAAQEARNPQRDMPTGILGSLAICTLVFILVAGLLTAMVSFTRLNVPDPIAVGIDATGVRILRYLVKVGAIAGLTSVMLVQLLGQSRIFFSMSRDGLLPPAFSRVHPRFRTPYVTTIVTGLACTFIAGALPLSILGPARLDRHPAGLHHRLGGRVVPAREGARARPTLPHAVGAGRSGARDPDLLRDDGRIARRHLAAARGLARDRAHDLLLVQPAAQRAAADRGGGARAGSGSAGLHRAGVTARRGPLEDDRDRVRIEPGNVSSRRQRGGSSEGASRGLGNPHRPDVVAGLRSTSGRPSSEPARRAIDSVRHGR